MQRPHNPITRRYVGKSGDIKKDLSQQQLAAIGAVAMAYNKVEEEIDDLFWAATQLKGPLSLEVVTRINGIDGKIAIIKAAANFYGMEEEDRRCLEEALGNGVFKRLKSYRDAVIHSRPINAAIGVGIRFDRQAKVNEVLINQKALDALYAHLLALADELSCAASVLLFAFELTSRSSDDPERSSYEAGRPMNSARFRDYRTRRQALPPIPEFPSEAEFREADVLWRQARQSAKRDFARQPSDDPHDKRRSRPTATETRRPVDRNG
jgi:hypothetical protein